MSTIAVIVLSTVNAPYGTSISAEQLATKIIDPASADNHDPAAFSFFSEVSADLQSAFLKEMHIERPMVLEVARKFSALAGYTLPLAQAA